MENRNKNTGITLRIFWGISFHLKVRKKTMETMCWGKKQWPEFNMDSLSDEIHFQSYPYTVKNYMKPQN